MQELADVGWDHEVLQVEFAEAFAEVDPEIEVVEHAELLAIADQQVVAVGVKGLDLQVFGFAAELRAHAVAHFCGGVVGVGEGEDFVGAGVASADQVCDAADEDGGLAGASAGDDQQGPVQVLDGLALVVVGLEAGGGRDGFRHRHWAGGYQRIGHGQFGGEFFTTEDTEEHRGQNGNYLSLKLGEHDCQWLRWRRSRRGGWCLREMPTAIRLREIGLARSLSSRPRGRGRGRRRHSPTAGRLSTCCPFRIPTARCGCSLAGPERLSA